MSEEEDRSNDYYLSPHLLALESKMETLPIPYHEEDTLGFVYENDNQSVIRITSHGFHVNNLNTSEMQSQAPIGHLTSDYLYGQSTCNFEENNYATGVTKNSKNTTKRMVAEILEYDTPDCEDK